MKSISTSSLHLGVVESKDLLNGEAEGEINIGKGVDFFELIVVASAKEKLSGLESLSLALGGVSSGDVLTDESLGC